MNRRLLPAELDDLDGPPVERTALILEWTPPTPCNCKDESRCPH